MSYAPRGREGRTFRAREEDTLFSCAAALGNRRRRGNWELFHPLRPTNFAFMSRGCQGDQCRSLGWNLICVSSSYAKCSLEGPCPLVVTASGSRWFSYLSYAPYAKRPISRPVVPGCGGGGGVGDFLGLHF